MNYAGQEQNGVCVQCIVGTAEWAAAHLGGVWHDASDKVGVGWLWTELYGWQPPEVIEELGEQWEL